MGLASALTTALTGMTAAESQIDVAGNNLANSQTVGFKSSRATFATQFLQTQSLGSAPTDTTGGTNPRQVGLGVRVAEITPDFTQGTIQGTSSPSDLAIQGEGFFMVEGPQGERLYTRNGQFKTNSENELVTTTGQRVLGFGVDSDYNVESTTLVPLTIPLGTAAVARATSVVTMQGVLSPSGQVADTAGVIESATLGDDSIPRPDTTGASVVVAPVPNVSATTTTNTEGTGGTHPEGATYRYRIVFADDSGTESTASSDITVTTPAGDTLANNTITLNNLPTSAGYSNVHIYRTDAGGSTFKFLANAAMGGSYVDDNSVPLSAATLDTSTINGNYSYLVTYARAGEEESRPSPLLGPVNVVNGRVHLTNLPTPPVPGPGDTFPAYDKIRIYRNTSTDSSQFYLVEELNPGEEYTDSKSDAAISDLTVLGNQRVDLDGPKIDPNTLLVNVTKRDQLDYQHLFDVGTLSFTARKGGRELTPQEFEITATTTVQDLMVFMQNSVGIQTSLDDPQNPIPSSLNNIPGETTALPPGVTIQDGKIRIVSNNGVDNEVTIDLSGFRITTATSDVETPSLGFGTVQEGRGNSAVADFVAYDTLGIPINVRITTVLERLSDSSTVYRWYADSPGNHPTSGTDISVGTGLITFDGQGNLVSTTNDRVSIARRQEPSNDPLEFQLDFSQVSGLASDKSSLAAARQDGSAAGTLSSFIIGEDGGIRGVFSNGVTRDLGQIRLATFANPQGLEQRGQNMFAQGVNSGLPVEGNPGEGGTGSIIAGATELSNTDIGKNLIDLVLATTQYRGNARVITAAQQLLDELLNLRR
jgi:flagellar hook protein FlgE